MANEHSIRVTAKGEFGQLKSGLKSLQTDLKGVLGEIDRGARKGGIFDDTQLRALTVYKNRFKSSMEDLNREFEKQNRIIDKLHEKMQKASRQEQEDLEKEIKLREKNLDVIRKQLFEVEKLYEKRNREAKGFGTSPAKEVASGGGGFGGILSGGRGLLGGLGRMGLFGLGLAGIGGIASMASQAYQGAYQSRVGSLDLAQRMRGQGGFGGGAYNMWNRAYGIGTADNMGYTTDETWGFLDQYSRMAGTPSAGQAGSMLKFGRAYGLNTSEVASSVGSVIGSGGANAKFADMISASVEKSGMTPRILEVMETSAGLLAQMNTTLKDTGARQILAYQTTLDTIGMKNGMMSLTGKNGANIISGLGGIYDPGATDWKYMGMQALQRYNPQKYGKMGLYDLEASFEDGLNNLDNLPAMAGFLKEKSGGNENIMKRMLQKWLQAGGYNATKTQVNELYDVTGGLTAFDKDKMSKVTKDLQNGNSAENYQQRSLEIGQQILDTNARFEKQLEEFGQPMLAVVQSMKEDITKFMEWSTDNKDLQSILQGISDFLQANWKSLATVGAILALGKLLGGVGGLLFKGLEAIPSAIAKAIKSKKSDDDDDDDDDFEIPGVSKKMLKKLGKMGGKVGKLGKGAGWLGALTTVIGGSMMASDYVRKKNAENVTPQEQWYIDNNIPFGTKPSGTYDGIDFSKMTDKQFADWANDTKGMTKEQSDYVKKHMLKLQDGGEMSLEELRDDGTYSLEKLMRSGTASFDKFLKNSDGSMKTMTELLEDFVTAVSASVATIGMPSEGLGGGMGEGGSYDVRSKSGVTGSQLNKKLKGKLSGWGNEFVAVGKLFGIDPAVLASIAMHETGNGSSSAVKNKNNVGGIMGKNGLKSYSNMETGIYELGRILKEVYVNKGLTTIAEIQKRYAPVGASNDPTGLNNNWINGVSGFLGGFGVGGGVPSGGKSFWNGWQNRITSHFGSHEGFRHTAHKGLDINGEQGDYLDALTGGKISKIFYDDGSKRDKDGKKNSTKGGSTVVVKMADGTSYAYAHLSKINSGLKVGQSIQAGDWIGNMGGDKGKAGSGYSTTGSHLHLGYFDKNGKAIDPMKLMNKLMGGAGDLDLSEVMGGGGSSKTVNVNVKLSGAVEKLNGKTEASIKKIATQAIKEYIAHQQLVNPSRR